MKKWMNLPLELVDSDQAEDNFYYMKELRDWQRRKQLYLYVKIVELNHLSI